MTMLAATASCARFVPSARQSITWNMVMVKSAWSLFAKWRIYAKKYSANLQSSSLSQSTMKNPVSAIFTEEFMTRNTLEEEKKRQYEKPKVTKVRLVPEEAVLAVCKAGVQARCAPDPNCIANPTS